MTDPINDSPIRGLIMALWSINRAGETAEMVTGPSPPSSPPMAVTNSALKIICDGDSVPLRYCRSASGRRAAAKVISVPERSTKVAFSDNVKSMI